MVQTNEVLQVLLISPYPPPIGGNTVHVQRLLEFLLLRQHQAWVLDYTGKSAPLSEENEHVWYLKAGIIGKLKNLVAIVRKIDRGVIVHFHIAEMGRFKWIAPFLLLLFFRQTKVLTIHSGYFVQLMDYPAMRTYLSILFRFFDRIICVNKEQQDFLARKLRFPIQHTVIIPAFLLQAAAPELVPFEIQSLPSKKIKVITSGYLTKTYDYDPIIDCIEKISDTKIEFVFAFYHNIDPAYERHILNRLKPFTNVTILRDLEPGEFVSVLEQMNIYIRSTITDGDAVAIREALGFGKTVFATESVERPEACHLFAQGNTKELLALLRNHICQAKLNNVEMETNRLVVDNGSRIVEVYCAAINK